MRTIAVLFVLYLCKDVFHLPKPSPTMIIGITLAAVFAFVQDVQELNRD